MPTERLVGGSGKGDRAVFREVENADLLVKDTGVVDMFGKGEAEFQPVVGNQPGENLRPKAQVRRRLGERCDCFQNLVTIIAR
jgi:hypothetical protein